MWEEILIEGGLHRQTHSITLKRQIKCKMVANLADFMLNLMKNVRFMYATIYKSPKLRYMSDILLGARFSPLSPIPLGYATVPIPIKWHPRHIQSLASPYYTTTPT